MKRFSLASVMVMVAFSAMTAYFVREGIKMHRRGFTPGEITTVIGVPVAVGAYSLLGRRPNHEASPCRGWPKARRADRRERPVTCGLPRRIEVPNLAGCPAG